MIEKSTIVFILYNLLELKFIKEKNQDCKKIFPEMIKIYIIMILALIVI